eukprot:Em0004g1253a
MIQDNPKFLHDPHITNNSHKATIFCRGNQFINNEQFVFAISTQSLNHATGTEMTPREIDVVPKPQETYSRLFQDTPFYKPHQGRGAFNTQSVVTLAVQDHKELRESKSASSFLDVPLPRGYEKPVSSTESVANRNGDQTAVLQADRRIVGNTSPRIPTIPVYTDNEQEEDFVTVEELD